jgi:hypothetical protein
MTNAATTTIQSPNLSAHGATWLWAIKLEFVHTVMGLALFGMGIGLAAALGVNVFKFKFQLGALVVGLSFVSALISVWSMSSPLVKALERNLERDAEARQYLFYAMCLLRTLLTIGLMVLGVLYRRYWPDPFMEMPVLSTALAGASLLAVMHFQLRWANALAK